MGVEIEKPLVAIQVIAYWSEAAAKDLDKCMASIAAQTYPRERLRVVVVDNPSPHGTARAQFEEKWLPKSGNEMPEIVFVDETSNTGFAGGHSRAFEESKKLGADFVYLLNQDAMIDESAIEEAVKYKRSHPNMPIVQSKVMMIEDGGNERVNSCGNRMHYLGFGFCDTKCDMSKPHFYASGAAVLVETRVVDEIGGLFDSSYFMYHDDVDLSWRARLAGYDIGLAMTSTARHRYEFERSMTKFYWMERNRLLTHLTHLRAATLVLLLPAMIVMDLGTLFYSLLTGWTSDRVKVYGYFLKASSWRHVRARRKLVRSIRRVDDREMFRHMVDAIDTDEIKNPLLTEVVNPILGLYGRFVRWVISW